MMKPLLGVIDDFERSLTAAEAAGAPYIVVTAGADPAELRHATRPSAVVADFTERQSSLFLHTPAKRSYERN